MSLWAVTREEIDIIDGNVDDIETLLGTVDGKVDTLDTNVDDIETLLGTVDGKADTISGVRTLSSSNVNLFTCLRYGLTHCIYILINS